jgi:hypothetical protein
MLLETVLNSTHIAANETIIATVQALALCDAAWFSGVFISTFTAQHCNVPPEQAAALCARVSSSSLVTLESCGIMLTISMRVFTQFCSDMSVAGSSFASVLEIFLGDVKAHTQK